MKKLVNLAYGSVIVGIVGLILKYYAYVVTGSLALYSDALESIVNILASVAMLIAIRLSIQPADNSHHYGRYKAEYFSAIFEGMVIICVSFSILYEVYQGFNHPNHLNTPVYGLLISSLATIANAVWGWVMIKYGKSHHSPALVADGKHLLSDVVSSVGVMLGVSLVVITGWTILDPIIALVMSGYLLWVGWNVMRESIAGLMDAAPTEEEINELKQIINISYGDDAIEVHDLRIRRAARIYFIEFHLVVSGNMSVKKSHAICDDIEVAIKNKLPNASIMIHVEPENKAKNQA